MQKKSDFCFSTDSYNLFSIKTKKRGVGKKMLIKSGKMKKPIDWRKFISKDENKMQLIEIMLKVWSKDSFATHLQNRNITLIVKGTTYQLTSNDGINTIIRKIQLCHHLKKKQTQES